MKNPVTRAECVSISWSSGLPIFACEQFLKAVSDEYGWIGGLDEMGECRCVLPYTVIRGRGIRMARFRVETIPLESDFDADEERVFLDRAMEYLRSIRADVVIPATTNTIFNTYPKGADAAPYGSYVVDLCQEEDALWRNIDRITRQNIKTAQSNGVSIHSGAEHLDSAYSLIRDTFRRSKLPFMSHEALRRFVLGLGENGKILTAEYQGRIQSCVVYGSSRYCAYAIYGGNMEGQYPGANKLLHWEAIQHFRKEGVLRYDFVGARINPEKGSKQEAINSFKRRLGGKLRQGYMWKYSLRPVKSLVYSLGVRLLRGGDIVDRERHKLNSVGSSS
jgi:hypothetical protein